MYMILKPLKGKKYIAFIDFLAKYCDSYLFVLPNNGKTIVTKKNAELMEGYPIGYSCIEDQASYSEYKKQMDKYISVIENDVISKHYDTGYLDQITSTEIEVYHVSISDNVRKFFQQVKGFSAWVSPNYLEDPCFFANGKCVFQSITHENLYFLYLSDNEIEDFLKKERIKYEIMQPIDVPIL